MVVLNVHVPQHRIMTANAFVLKVNRKLVVNLVSVRLELKNKVLLNRFCKQ